MRLQWEITVRADIISCRIRLGETREMINNNNNILMSTRTFFQVKVVNRYGEGHMWNYLGVFASGNYTPWLQSE